MNSLTGPDSVLLEFLLGGLTAEERERLEEQAFVDDAVHEQLEATADDLIHAYLTGALSAADRQRFESFFLASPRRRERLEFVRQLISAVDRVSAKEPSRRPRWWARPAVAAVATGAVLLGLLSQLGGPGREPPPPDPRPSLEATPPAAAFPRKPPLRPGVMVVRPTRGRATPTTLDLREQPQAVKFEIAVAEGALSFDAAISGADGAQVWSAVEIPPPDAGKPLVVTVPASAFSGSGERYALRIQAEALRSAGPSPASVEYALRALRR